MRTISLHFEKAQRARCSCLFLCVVLWAGVARAQTPSSTELAAKLGITFVNDSQSVVILERDRKRYAIDVANRRISEVDAASTNASTESSQPASSPASTTFAQKCAVCHGADAKGLRAVGTPNLVDPAVQSRLSDRDIADTIRNGKGGRMPAWSGKLSEAEISGLVAYIRSLPSGARPGATGAAGQAGQAAKQETKPSTIYEPGDDFLMSLPTGRPAERHGVYVNFSHRFAYDPAFSGTGRGGVLFGLDGYAIPSLGLTYGITDKLSASIYRSPSVIGRPIQLMTAYNFLSEHRGSPLNLTVRVSIEGQNNFRKNYTENIEAILSKSLGRHAQIYAVPTMSFNARPLAQGGFRSADIPNFPGINAFSVGVGAAVDIRPTVALLAEVIPTVVNGTELGMHRPAYSFGIQKKIWRHAFTFGFSNSPGTTVSQRAGTRASFVGNPSADTPSGLIIGFNLTRQIK